MAAATVTATAYPYPDGSDNTKSRRILYGTLAFQASPALYETGGLPISFLGINDENNLIQVTQGPYANRVEMSSRSGSGYVYSYTTADLWVKLFTSVSAVLGQSVVVANPATNILNLFTITTAGTTGSTEPVWVFPNPSNPNPTTTDNGAVWTAQGPTSGLVQVLQSAGSAAPNSEITGNSAIPAGVSGDVVSFKAEFVNAKA